MRRYKNAWLPFSGHLTCRRRGGPKRRQTLGVQELEDRRLLSGVPSLVADINKSPTSSASSDPQHLVSIGETLYFTADDGVNGRELWKTDGTAQGTVLVKDIQPGNSGSSPGWLTAVGNTLFFTADDGVHGRELWRSDGTEAGTVLVKDIRTGSTGSGAQEFTLLNSTLFFIADNGVNGSELWKSDGTTQGTTLVKDIAVGSNSSAPYFLHAAGASLFFWADSNFNFSSAQLNRVLWKSDGTTAGTVMVRNIRLPTNPTAASQLFSSIGDTYYFVVNEAPGSNNNLGLWKSDGTSTGTVRVRQFATGFGNAVSQLTAVGDTLFFSAKDTTTATLWKSDGTFSGTVKVKTSGRYPWYPSSLAAIGSMLYFRAYDSTNGLELWRSDGTDAGTQLVKDIWPGTNGSGSTTSDWALKAIGGTLYFAAENGSSGVELWRSDGTTDGTQLVRDIRPGAATAWPIGLTAAGSRLYFNADDGRQGRELWSLRSPPTTVRLSTTEVAENLAVGTTVGYLNTTDEGLGTSIQYSFVPGTGATDNSSFRILGDKLVTNRVFDYETKATHSIRVRGTDQYGLFAEKSISINVLDINESPTLNPAVSPALLPAAFNAGPPVAGQIVGATRVSLLVTNAGTKANYSDPENALPAMAITGLDLQGGRLWYSINAGATWRELTTASEDSALVLYADSNTYLFYAAHPGTSPLIENAIAFRAHDRRVPNGFATGRGVGIYEPLGVYVGVSENWLQGSRGAVVAISETRVAYVDNSGAIQLLDVSAPANPALISDIGGVVRSAGLALSPDSNLLASISRQYGIGLYGFNEGKSAATFLGSYSTTAYDLAWAASGNLAYVAAYGDGLHVIDLSSPTNIRRLARFDTVGLAQAVAVSPNDRFACVADGENGLLVFDVSDPARPVLSATYRPGAPVTDVVFSPDGKHVYIAAGIRGVQTLLLDQAGGISLVGGFSPSSLPISGYKHLRISRDGSLILARSSTWSSTLVLDARDPKELKPAAWLLDAEDSDFSADLSFIFSAQMGRGFAVFPLWSLGEDGFSSATDTIQVSVRNSAPAGVVVSGTVIAENLTPSSFVGRLSSSDLDAGNTFTYTLVPGVGDSGNQFFNISGDRLLTAATFDYETQSSYSIRVRTTDQGGLYIEKVFTITITDVVEDWSLEQGPGETIVDPGARSGSSRLVKAGLGTLILDQANTHTGGTIVEAGELVLRNSAALGTGILQVAPGAKVTLDVGTRQVQVSRLELSATGMLDLTTGSVLLAPGNYDLVAMRGFIAGARGTGSWTGPGITSSNIQPGSFREVGYQLLPDGSLKVGYSAVGDANMDGTVSVQDLIALNAGGKYGTAATDAGWWQGDFNYDGRVNVTDLIALVSSGLYGAGSYLPSASAAVSDFQATGAAEPGLSAVPTGFSTIQTLPEGQPEPILIETSTAPTARAPEARRVNEFAWAAIANQSEPEALKDKKVSRWRMVGR